MAQRCMAVYKDGLTCRRMNYTADVLDKPELCWDAANHHPNQDSELGPDGNFIWPDVFNPDGSPRQQIR